MELSYKISFYFEVPGATSKFKSFPLLCPVIQLQYKTTRDYKNRCEKRLISTLANPLLIQRSTKSRNMSFTNRRHPDLRLYPLSPLPPPLHPPISSQAYINPIAQLTLWPEQPFFHRRKRSRAPSVLPDSSQFIHPSFMQLGNEPVSISIGNRERQDCAARLFVVLMLRTNSSITRLWLRIVTRYSERDIHAWLARAGIFFLGRCGKIGAAGKLQRHYFQQQLPPRYNLLLSTSESACLSNWRSNLFLRRLISRFLRTRRTALTELK